MIQLKSKALQSDLIILRNSCKITEEEEYIAVHSLQNSYFHWGNFLIFHQAPKETDISRWEEYFCHEFPECIHQHRAFTWVQGADLPDFKVDGYSIENMVCLTAKKVQPADQIHPDITFRRIQSDKDWLELEQKQIGLYNPKDLTTSLLVFNKQRLKEYRAMVEDNLGDWFIADLEGNWVADLGLFYGEEMARYQNVTTYPGFEGRGIAHALVYASAKYAFKNYPIKELIIVAEKNSRAQKIYQNLGFKISEKRANLYRSLC